MMTHLYLHPDKARTLVVIFLGWGFPSQLFSNLSKRGCHFLLLSGYADTTSADVDAEVSRIAQSYSDAGGGYTEIIVVGWSFGVKVASRFIADTKLPVTLRLAINGTEYHIDDHRGIPVSIFNGTLEKLDAASLRKFRIRCAGDVKRYQSLWQNCETWPSDEDLSNLKTELEWFSNLPPVPPSGRESLWDKVIVGEGDRIFPPGNQVDAWTGNDVCLMPDMPHLPDFQRVLDEYLVDKSKVRDKFCESGESYAANATVQDATAHALYRLFKQVWDRTVASASPKEDLAILELGSGDGTFTKYYADDFLSHTSHLTLCDLQINPVIASIVGKFSERIASGKMRVDYVSEDAESRLFRQRYMGNETLDIVFSSSMFQWLHSPAGMVKACANALRPGGIIAVSYYGPETCREISELTGAGLKYPSTQWMAKSAKDYGLKIEEFHENEVIMRFDSPYEALRHLRLTGVNALSGTQTPSNIRRLLKEWPLDDGGRAILTFHPVYFILSKEK